MFDKKEYIKQWRNKHKKEISEYNIKYHKEHLKRININRIEYDKSYRDKHKEDIKKQNRRYFVNNKEKVYSINKQWRDNNPDKAKEEYRRAHIKHRQLGFIPLNKPFENCEGHHISENFVIYIPEKLHKSIWHNIWTWKNMNKINQLAIGFLN